MKLLNSRIYVFSMSYKIFTLKPGQVEVMREIVMNDAAEIQNFQIESALSSRALNVPSVMDGQL